jgi:hypothetical protein
LARCRVLRLSVHSLCCRCCSVWVRECPPTSVDMMAIACNGLFATGLGWKRLVRLTTSGWSVTLPVVVMRAPQEYSLITSTVTCSRARSTSSTLRSS